MACRAIVYSVKQNADHKMQIIIPGMDIRLEPDKILCHDMAMALQSFFRRKGKDTKRDLR